MNKRSRKILLFVAAALVAACGLPLRAQSAPPGWELRNGSWVPIVQPDPATPAGQVAQMIKDLDAKNTKTVIENARQWLKDNKTNPLVPQVLILQSDAEVARGTKYKALYPLEDLVNNFPTSELYTAVLEREYDIADAFLQGYRKKTLGMRIFTVYEDGVDLMDRIQDRARGSPLAERAGIRVADFYYDSGQFPEAIDAYSDFLKRYGFSQYVRKAEVRRAEASVASFKGVKFDVTPLLDASERLATIREAYPQTAQELQVTALEDRILQLDGQKELEIARYYWRAGQLYASAYYYKRVMRYWPGTQMAQTAQDELTRRLPDKVDK
jgi:outer membrane protein assembly factor BamD (BamD/ComL family)